MGKAKQGSGRWPPRMFKLREIVIILVAWGTSALGMAATELIIHIQVYSSYRENLGVATFSGQLVAGLLILLGTLGLLGRIMR